MNTSLPSKDSRYPSKGLISHLKRSLFLVVPIVVGFLLSDFLAMTSIALGAAAAGMLAYFLILVVDQRISKLEGHFLVVAEWVKAQQTARPWNSVKSLRSLKELSHQVVRD